MFIIPLVLGHLDALNFSDNTCKVNGENVSLVIGFDGGECNQLFLVELLKFIILLLEESLALRDL